MATWEVVVGSNTYPIAEVNITKSLSSLNNADFVTTVSLALDTEVTIKYNGSIVFIGYIKNRTETEDKLYRYTVIERAVELETQIVKNGTGSYVFTLTNQTVDDIISTILNGTDWTAGSSDNSAIQAISFAYTNKLTALFKVLREIKGYYVWFDNSTKKVYWGTSRTDQGTIDYIKKEVEEETYKRNITKVIVFGNEEDTYGEAGSDETAVAIYKYADAKTPEECTSVASTILSELQNPYHRISITTTVNPNINEGDLVTVDGSSYVVQEINMDMYEMKMDLNARRKSIFEVLGGKLTEMSGTVKVGKKVTSTYDGGWSFVSSTSPAKYKLHIDDVSNIESFTIDVTVSNLKKMFSTGTEYANITSAASDVGFATTDNALTNITSTEYLSIPPVVTSDYEFSLSSSVPFSETFILDSGLGSDGFAFALVTVILVVENNDSIYGYAMVEIYAESEYYNTLRLSTYVAVSPNTYQAIPVSFIVEGRDDGGDNISVEVNVDSNVDMDVVTLKAYAYFVGRHYHPIVDKQHANPIPDNSHGHITSDTGHNPNVTEDVQDVSSYPSNVEVIVNGSTVDTITGGTEETATIDITANLQSGENVIEIVPTSGKGSVYVGGRYTHIVLS